MTEESREVLTVWRMWRGGFGPGHLPEAGGILEQNAGLVEALQFMDGVAARLEKKSREARPRR